MMAANLVKIARDFANLDRPQERVYRSLETYFDIHKPLYRVENYMRHREDIMTIMPSRDTTWLDEFIEKVFEKLHSRCLQVCSWSLHQVNKITNRQPLTVDIRSQSKIFCRGMKIPC